jgi:hypothetical protein
MKPITGKRWVSTALILAAVAILIWAICQPHKQHHRGGNFGSGLSSEITMGKSMGSKLGDR